MTADPRGAREAVEASIPRQRDAGVMGYVAELQQFDDSMTVSAAGDEPEGEPAPESPAARPADPRPGPARTPLEPMERPLPAGGGRGPAGPGSSRAGAAPGAPRRPERPPWSRAEVGLAVAFVLVAAVAIVGGAYAVLMANRPPTGDVRLPLPSAEAAGEQAPPVTGGSTPGGAPGAGPGAPASPSAAPSPSASTVDSAAPGASPTPEETSAPPAPADLVATYAREANTGLLGLTGYRGKVTISNRGQGAADGWTVTLSLPAGQKVDSVVGADARQSGDLVTFTPLAGSGEVAAGAEVSFTFDVPGLLAGEPTGCAIDGRPCQ